MDLEIIIPSEASQRQISDDITHMWNLQYDTNELTYKTERDSQTWKPNLRLLPKGEVVEGSESGSLGSADKTTNKGLYLGINYDRKE